MKKKLFVLALAIMPFAMFAQKKVTVKAGTIIPLLSVQETKAADVTEGQTIDFRVAQDVKIDGVCVIPQGTIAKGRVSEARKSTVGGTKGKLIIDIPSLTLENGDPLFFSNTQVRVYGHNRTPVAVVVGLFTCGIGCLIPGSKEVLPPGYEVQATVASNTELIIR